MDNYRESVTRDRVLEFIGERGIIRAKEAEEIGVSRVVLGRLVDEGLLSRVGRGLYSLAEDQPSGDRSLAEVAKRVPGATVCLLSALRFHEFTTQNPSQVWIAISNKAWSPAGTIAGLRVVRMSATSLEQGREEHVLDGVSVPIFSPAKTIADCFKFRSVVGLDVAVEATRAFVRSSGSLDELWRMAKVTRTASVMRPYLEAIVTDD